MYKDNVENAELKNAVLYDEDGRLWLELTYRYRIKGTLYELCIPKVNLGIATNMVPVIVEDSSSDMWVRKINEYHMMVSDGMEYQCLTVDSFQGKPIEPSVSIIKIIEKAPVEITMSELEQKLGYKIKLVSEKEPESEK